MCYSSWDHKKSDTSWQLNKCVYINPKLINMNLLTKVHIVKAIVFPVVMYGCESWTIKKAEHLRIDAFAVVLEKTPESSLDCKEIKPVNPKGNQP